MTTAEAVNILRELLQEGEFQKVLHGAGDVLAADPGNAEAMVLLHEAQTLIDHPEEVVRLREEGRRVERTRKTVVMTASLFMMAALALNGYAFFVEQQVPPVVEAPLTYTLEFKTDPVDPEGIAPFQLSYMVRGDIIPNGVVVTIDPGNGDRETTVPAVVTYQKPGLYTARGRAVGPDGTELSTSEVKVSVHPKMEATLAATPGAGMESLTVAFKSVVTGSNDISYFWSFGDGGSDTVANPTHTYNNKGTYMAKLVATTSDNGRIEKSIEVTVEEPTGVSTIPSSLPSEVPSETPSSIPQTGGVSAVIGTIPKSLDGVSLAGTPPFTVLFSAGASSSANASLTSFHWDFGDTFDSDEMSSIHTFSRPGLYKVTLTVSDAAGMTSTQILTVNVKAATTSQVPTGAPSALVARIDTDVAPLGAAPLSITFDGAGSKGPSGKITNYEWDFGDNSTLGSGPRVSHIFQSSGRYTVTLTVTSDTGATASQAITVTVSES